LDSFRGQLHGSRVEDFRWAKLSERPNWISHLQGAVALSNFGGNIEASRVNNLPTIAGEKGDTGAQGIQGLKGDTGAQGIQGLKGDTGAQGIQGLKDDMGLTVSKI